MTDRGSGEPVVFVHGIPTDYRAWTNQVSALADGFRSISYSRRFAFPNTNDGSVRQSTVETNTADLAELIGRLTTEPVHLVGHSFGGFIAAFLAATRPSLLRSLTLIEPAIASLLLRNPDSRGQALRLFFRHPTTALSASRFLKNSNRPALKAVEEGSLEEAVRLNVSGVEDRRGALETFPEPIRSMMVANGRSVAETGNPYPPLGAKELRSVQTPTLLVNGETSVLWLRQVGAMAAAAIPKSRRVAISGAGHYPHLQQPAAVNRQLLSFLSSSTARKS